MRLINKNETKDINYDLVTLNIAESENGLFTLLAHVGKEAFVLNTYTNLESAKAELSHLRNATVYFVGARRIKGPIKVRMINNTDKAYDFKKGNKVGPMVLIPTLLADIEPVDELYEATSGRNNDGWGSSGK